MTLCEFCILKNPDGLCSAGRSTPKKMRCIDFTPSIERFCDSRADYKGRGQLRQMAVYFGLAGKELQRVLALSEVQRGEAG